MTTAAGNTPPPVEAVHDPDGRVIGMWINNNKIPSDPRQVDTMMLYFLSSAVISDADSNLLRDGKFCVVTNTEDDKRGTYLMFRGHRAPCENKDSGGVSETTHTCSITIQELCIGGEPTQWITSHCSDRLPNESSVVDKSIKIKLDKNGKEGIFKSWATSSLSNILSDINAAQGKAPLYFGPDPKNFPTTCFVFLLGFSESDIRNGDTLTLTWKEAVVKQAVVKQVPCAKCGKNLPEPIASAQDGLCAGCKNTKNGCFIATACYGSRECVEVECLRVFRDKSLLKRPLGRVFTSIYYLVSPPIARWLDNHPAISSFIRRHFLDGLVRWADKMNSRMPNKMPGHIP
jgi:hypothetical protein